MNAFEPPRLTTWLLQRLAPRHKRESLIGDLVERYQHGRSAGWYRRQAVMAILVGAGTDIRDHLLLAVRALVLCWTALFLLGSFTGALHRSLFRWANTEWESEILRQAWVYYGVPFVAITCLGCAATGWLIARLHRDQRAAMVILCALSQLPWAVRWGWETCRLLRAGLFPFWDFRIALLFTASTLFLVYPLCILLGGLWDARSDADATSRIPVQ
jgi:hypothetical protein